MARERISLIPEAVQEERSIESKIRSGEINPEIFATLPPEEQSKINGILFKMASSGIDSNQGVSALEFITLSSIRLLFKMVNHQGLTDDDMKIKASLDRIFKQHELLNSDVSMEDWLFDYMGYAEYKSGEILNNRKEHIERKIEVTGRA